MSTPINYHVEDIEGRKYAVLPLEQFTGLVERAGVADALTLPGEVKDRHQSDGASLIRAWREYLNINQQALAQRMNVTQSQIAQWERPDARPRLTTLQRIATALGIHISQLVTDE